MAGLTSAGFTPARLSDITEEMRAELRALLGEDMTFADEAPETHLVNAIADRLSDAWEETERVYLSQSPDTAEGAALDRVAALNLLSRLPATYSSVTVRIMGDESTAVTAGDLEISVLNNPTARFATTEDALLETAYNAKQILTFSDTTASGAFTLTLGDETTGSIAWNAAAAAVETALEALTAVGSGNVTVTGSFALGFTVEFMGTLAATGMDMLEVAANTLEDSGSGAIDITITENQIGGFGDDVEAQALTTGPFAAPAGSLSVIETPIAGVDRVTNALAADVGSDLETDAAFRLRRAASLQRAGTAALEGIRTAISLVADVDIVYVFENATNVVNVEGQPPNSIEAVVLGGADEDIAKAIWAAKAAGIQTYGTETVSFIDDYGVSRTVQFSRPVEVRIYFEVDIVPNTDANESDVYPTDGDDQVKAAIVAYALANQTVGRDVITTKYFVPVNEVDGVNGIVIRVGTAPNPATSTNITITARQVATVALADIEVDSTP